MRSANSSAALIARLGSPWSAALLLAGFYALVLLSLRDKSPTFDEPGHAVAGYSYWIANDYRIDPENGNLTKRWFALPYLFNTTIVSPTTSEWWRRASTWHVADDWLYRTGNDPDKLVAQGRAFAALLAVAGGCLVWAWSRRLFGPIGAVFSLLLFVTFPGYLANGGLMTSDIAVSFLLLAATGAWWRLLNRLSISHMLLAGLATGALFLSKMSAFGLIPIVAALVVVKLIDPRPVPAPGGRTLHSRTQKAVGFALATLVQGALLAIMIWAAFGFRYSAFNPATAHAGDKFFRSWYWALDYVEPVSALERLNLDAEQKTRAIGILSAHSVLIREWEHGSSTALAEIRRTVLTPQQQRQLDGILASPPGLPQRAIKALSDWRLLPESYLYGFANVFSMDGNRGAYLNGELSEEGWRSYFPYIFAIKTPLLIIATFAFALHLVIRSAPHPQKSDARWRHMIEVSPLLIFLIVYWTFAIFSKTNIGHRHLLPVYGPLFILSGGVAAWAWAATGKLRTLRLAAIGAVAAVGIVEVALHFPNYLTYFNGVVSPRTAYRHVIDSSLDWGQDLPATARYIQSHPEKKPYYVSYFGTASPRHHGVAATSAYSYAGTDLIERPVFHLLFDCEASGNDPKFKAFAETNPDYDARSAFGFTAPDGRPGAAFARTANSLRLGGGTYLISASLTQPLFFRDLRVTPTWNDELERGYRELEQQIAPLLSDDLFTRRQALRMRGTADWVQIYTSYIQYRFMRFTFALREKTPEDVINNAVLVYRLSDAEVTQMLQGPVPGATREPSRFK